MILTISPTTGFDKGNNITKIVLLMSGPILSFYGKPHPVTNSGDETQYSK
jgi:hypothetical protein